MVVAVAQINLFREFLIQSAHTAGCNHQPRTEPRRDKVRYIIQSGACRPEILISVILISDHGIQRIDCLIRKSQHRSSYCHIKKRSDHSVGGILRYGLHGSLRDSLLIQAVRVSSHNH